MSPERGSDPTEGDIGAHSAGGRKDNLQAPSLAAQPCRRSPQPPNPAIPPGPPTREGGGGATAICLFRIIMASSWGSIFFTKTFPPSFLWRQTMGGSSSAAGKRAGSGCQGWVQDEPRWDPTQALPRGYWALSGWAQLAVLVTRCQSL